MGPWTVLALVTGALAMTATPAPAADRPSIAFAGGSAFERQQVVGALDASAFDWDVLDRVVTVRIAAGVDSHAVPGEVWLDADLLDAGKFAWGTVQHEFAHEVDFLLLDDAQRAELLAQLGGVTWCDVRPGLRHADYGCERFASTLAWAYWPSPENALRPSGPGDEAAALPAPAFRTLLARMLGVPDSLAPRRTARRL